MISQNFPDSHVNAECERQMRLLRLEGPLTIARWDYTKLEKLLKQAHWSNGIFR